MKDPIAPIAALVVLGMAVGAYYFWIRTEQEATPPPVLPPKTAPVAEAPTPTSPPAPEIRYPIQSSPPEKPLPQLAESETPIQEVLTALIDKEQLKRFNLDTPVRRFVVTVDELSRASVPQKYDAAKPVPGKFLTLGADADLAIDPRNYRRYAPYVSLIEAIDTKRLSAIYVRFYPLLQEEYRNIGSQKKYFNDRVVETIDNLLAAPELDASPKLAQPKVFYVFADPKIEELSAGQKIMIRMGSENAARIKAKLREIRAEITAVR